MNTILALQPEARRIGYAVFEGNKLVDWGSKWLVSEPLQKRTSSVALPFFREIIERCEPDVIVVPRPTRIPGTARNRFLRAIRHELASHPIPVSSFSRHDIQQRFRVAIRSERPNKDSIMQALVKRFPELLRCLSKPRRRWESDDYWAPMFAAVSLAITYLYHNE